MKIFNLNKEGLYYILSVEKRLDGHVRKIILFDKLYTKKQDAIDSSRTFVSSCTEGTTLKINF